MDSTENVELSEEEQEEERDDYASPMRVTVEALCSRVGETTSVTDMLKGRARAVEDSVSVA